MTSETRPSERSEEALWKSGVLSSMQRVSEARGLTFYVDPPREVIPDFLGNYQPDAMARGPEGGMIIEVKRLSNNTAEKRYAEIYQKVSRQKGWAFYLIHLDPAADWTLPDVKPTWPQLQAAFKEVEALATGGHRAAALVGAWAALEALARLARTEGGTGTSGASALQAVQALAEEGFVENEAADRLSTSAALRDAVVHGDFSVDVSADQVQALVQDVRMIASDIEATLQSLNRNRA